MDLIGSLHGELAKDNVCIFARFVLVSNFTRRFYQSDRCAKPPTPLTPKSQRSSRSSFFILIAANEDSPPNTHSLSLPLYREQAMEVEHSTPDRKLTRSGNGIVFEKTPPQALQTVQRLPVVGADGLKNTAPHFITGPKAFSFTERYMSPTDRILSPISKGLLARNRKLGMLLPPSSTPPKNLDLSL